MPPSIIRIAVRSLFWCTRRSQVDAQCRAWKERYQELAYQVNDETGRLGVRVPRMPGVDEDMRDWSFFMILEHHRIVNRAITQTVVNLARNEPLSGDALMNPKTDVMPSPNADASQVPAFLQSIEDHLEAVKALPGLRGTRTSRHPVFGDFDAHRWHNMFAFHLRVHYAQAKHVVHHATTQAGHQSA